jgi:AAA domain
MSTAQEILARNRIDYIASRKGKFTTKCPTCSGGYLNVEEKSDGVVWYCPNCEAGGGGKFDESRFTPGGDLGPIKAVFDYTDESGNRLFQVLKYEPLNAPKTFRQRIGPEQDNWSIKGVRRVLYRLPELIADIAAEHVIFLVEGEKDVNTLRAHNVPTTTNPMGATTEERQAKGSGWLNSYSETLRGADVVLCGDNDTPGREHVRIVANNLHSYAKRVRVLDLAQHWPEIKESDDVTDWFEAGGTVEQLWGWVEALDDWTSEAKVNGLDALIEATPNYVTDTTADAKPTDAFQLKPFDEIMLSTAPSYLVKGIIPRTGIAVVWGPPKCGKSFWTFDLVMHVALGWPYRGRRVQQGPIVYLALEGPAGFRARVEAWRQRHLTEQHDRVPFYLLDVPVDLVADRDKLITTIRAQIGEQPPAAVVVDTLNRALLGDENKSDDMAKFIRAADFIRVAFGCVVIIIHHCGIAGSRPRGHTSLAGADDAQIAVERDAKGTITVTVEHMKDGDTSAPIGSRLERVDLGTDDDGDPITSCVILPVEDGIAARKPKLPAAAKLALDLLQQLIAGGGEPAPASNHIPKNVPVVCSAELWREHFYKASLGKRDTKKKAFGRAVTRLQELHFIGVWNDKAWLAGHGGHAGH